MPSMTRPCSARSGCADERFAIVSRCRGVPTIDMYDILADPDTTAMSSHLVTVCKQPTLSVMDQEEGSVPTSEFDVGVLAPEDPQIVIMDFLLGMP